MVDREQLLTWTSSNPAVASLTDDFGPVASATGNAAGSATMTASVDGVSGSMGLSVSDPPASVDNATAAGNSLPAEMSEGQFYAVSVKFQNTGTTTWSSANGYGTGQTSPGADLFSPGSAGLATSTAPGQQGMISFNLVNLTTPGSYWVAYRMQRDGAWFGAENGKTITVTTEPCTKYCTLAMGYEEALVPGGALDGARDILAPSGEIIQRLSVGNYRLRLIEGDGVSARIQYYGSLIQPWPVDVTFRIEAPPGMVVPGQARKNVLIQGYEVVVEPGGSGVTLVHLRRVDPNAAIPAGEMLLLDIPLHASEGGRLPERLGRVELTVSR
jgi:hypothetical protein